MIKSEVKIRIPHTKEIHYRILTDKAFYDKRLKPMAKILLMHLLGNHSKDYTFSIPQLAKVLNTSESSIDRSVSNLRKYGYLTSTSIGGKKNGLQSWWVFELPDYLANTNTDAGKDLGNVKNENLGDTNTDTLYNNIGCGGTKSATPQPPIEETKTTKSVLEMTKEELDNYLPF